LPYPAGDRVASAQSAAIALTLAGMATLAVAMAVGRFAFTPLLPMMQADAGLSLTAGAALASANYLGYLAGSLMALSVTRATHLPIRAGLVLVSAGTAAMGVADAPWAWFALRFMTGVASAWVLIFAATWVFSRLAEIGQPRWGAFVFTGIGCGIAGTGALCLALVAADVGSALTWMVLGGISALATMAVWPFYRPVGVATGAATPAGRTRFGPAAKQLIVAYGLVGFAYIVPATFLPLMAREALADTGAADWAYAAFWPLVGLAAAASTLSTLRLRLPDDHQFRWGLVALLAGVAAPVLSSHPLAIGLSAVLVGGTFVFLTLTALRVARSVEPSHATRLFAVMTIWFALGQIAGPLVAERLVALQGSFTLALAVAGFSLMLAVLVAPVSSVAQAMRH